MIQVFRPKVDVERILAELRPILESGWIGLGPKTKEFEGRVAKFLNTNHFVALNSCTSALHLAIKCLNLRKGSLILTTPNTFVSTNHAIMYEGHYPVFADIEPLTGNIDPASIEKLLTYYGEAIRAIVVVHIAGYSCDMIRINQIANLHGIPVIEDCAHAFGSLYNNRKVGDTDNLCCWSFQAVKNLPVGDGGGISTNNPELYARLNRLRWLGIDKDTVSRSHLATAGGYNWDYEVDELGYKYHMNDLSAALGLIGLETLEENNIQRRAIAQFYLENIHADVVPDYQDNRLSATHFIPLFFENREVIYQKLRNAGIYCGMHYKMNHKYAMYSGLPTGKLEGADWYEKHELTLPCHLDLDITDLEQIVEIINE
jgi:perosamine synthetase